MVKKNDEKKRKKRITYCENEIVAMFENFQEKLSSSPHHLDEILRHVDFFTFEINPFCFQYETVHLQKLAPIIGNLINSYQENVMNKRPCSFSQPKAVEKYIKHGGFTLHILFNISPIHYGNYHCFVSHWSFGQSTIKGISTCFNVWGALQGLHTIQIMKKKKNFLKSLNLSQSLFIVDEN